MLVLLCSFILSTGQPRCDVMRHDEALATMMTVNAMEPRAWTAARTETPLTIFPADKPPAGYMPASR